MNKKLLIKAERIEAKIIDLNEKLKLINEEIKNAKRKEIGKTCKHKHRTYSSGHAYAYCQDCGKHGSMFTPSGEYWR